MPIGDVEQMASKRSVCVYGKHHPAQWIHSTRIEAAGNQDQFWLEAIERGYDYALEGRVIGAFARSGRQRYVDICSGSGSGSVIRYSTRVDWIIVVLMQRDRQHARILVEEGFRSIAMMNIPVNDGNPLHFAGSLCMTYSDGNIAK